MVSVQEISAVIVVIHGFIYLFIYLDCYQLA